MYLIMVMIEYESYRHCVLGIGSVIAEKSKISDLNRKTSLSSLGM